jgi:hypothetical protein
VEDRSRIQEAIKKAEQYEALKRALLRLLDDPHVQQNIMSLLRNRLGHMHGNKPLRAGPYIEVGENRNVRNH